MDTIFKFPWAIVISLVALYIAYLSYKNSLKVSKEQLALASANKKSELLLKLVELKLQSENMLNQLQTMHPPAEPCKVHISEIINKLESIIKSTDTRIEIIKKIPTTASAAVLEEMVGDISSTVLIHKNIMSVATKLRDECLDIQSKPHMLAKREGENIERCLWFDSKEAFEKVQRRSKRLCGREKSKSRLLS